MSLANCTLGRVKYWKLMYFSLSRVKVLGEVVESVRKENLSYG